MIINFKCPCGNNDPCLAYEYDGALGYEAVICKVCGKYCDEQGEHEPDEFSKQFIKEN
jgi:hypothetical protein